MLKIVALARVEGPFNAISIFGSAVGQVMFYGRGAGMMPTASAVVADIIDVALGNSGTTFRHLHLKPRHEVEPPIEPIDDTICRYYIKVMAKDEPGVVARYGKALGDNQISIQGRCSTRAQGLTIRCRW